MDPLSLSLKRNKMKYNCTDWTAIARGRYIAGLGEVADETSCSPAADLSQRGAAWTWTRDAPLPSCVRGAHGGRRRLVLAVQRLLSSTRARRPVSRRSPSSPSDERAEFAVAACVLSPGCRTPSPQRTRGVRRRLAKRNRVGYRGYDWRVRRASGEKNNYF